MIQEKFQAANYFCLGGLKYFCLAPLSNEIIRTPEIYHLKVKIYHIFNLYLHNSLINNICGNWSHIADMILVFLNTFPKFDTFSHFVTMLLVNY